MQKKIKKEFIKNLYKCRIKVCNLLQQTYFALQNYFATLRASGKKLIKLFSYNLSQKFVTKITSLSIVVVVVFTAFIPKVNAHLGAPIHYGIYNGNPSISLNYSNPYQKYGDTNSDFIINNVDLMNIKKSFGSKKGEQNYNPNCDFNYDGIIDGSDLLILAKHIGKDYRFDDYNGDGVPNIINEKLETSVTESPFEQIKNDKELTYISNVFQKFIPNPDYLVLLVASKTVKEAVNDYPFNVPPVKNNDDIVRIPVVMRFLQDDLIKNQKEQTEMEKLQNYISRNFTSSEIKYFYKLLNDDINILKKTNDIKKIDEISKSPRIDLYLSQIKNPDDDKIVNDMKQSLINVYTNASDLGKLVLNDYVFQALMKNYYNDQTLGFAILKNANNNLREEILKHPKTFLAYTFNTRYFINLNEFFTKRWERKLDIKNIQKKLKDGEFLNMVNYSEKNFKSYFEREDKINEIRKQYGNKFTLEDYLFPQLIFTFDPLGCEGGAFIQFFSKYVKDYHTYLKAFWDTSEQQDKLFKLLEKYYNNPKFSFFKDDEDAAKNIILIFEQNYGLKDRARKILPYDLYDKIIQDSRDFPTQYKEDFPKVDFDKVWDTTNKILTPNNGYVFYGICQNNQALVKRVFETLLLPHVSFDQEDYMHKKWQSGHIYSGIFLKDEIVNGNYLNGVGYGNNTYKAMDVNWISGTGDNFFGKLTNKSGGSFIFLYFVIWINNRNLMSQTPPAKGILNAVDSNPEIKAQWDKFKGNVISISMLIWMIKSKTRLIAFYG